MSRVYDHFAEKAALGSNEPPTFQELRLALLDIVDGRQRLTDYQVDELYSAVDGARYWLRKEKDHRDALRATGDCHQIEGAPV